MLYISTLFRTRYESIYKELLQHIEMGELQNTNDIWARDFMPIKSTSGKWILFRYFPQYLKDPRQHHLISDNQRVCDHLALEYQYSELILDGGSVVYCGTTYFVSERVLTDNHKWTRAAIEQELKTLFETDNVYLLPPAPDDFTGHLDGVIAFVDENTLLLSDFQDDYGQTIAAILNSLDKTVHLLPYNPYQNRTLQSAKGVYINYVKSGKHILLPVFKLPEDEKAIDILTTSFPNHNIIPIYCNTLATQGGLLHCISWEED